MVVQLKHATLPAPFGLIAAHYWFTVLQPESGRCDRWEVWQSKDAGGVSTGHLHCNLKAPDAGVGGGQARVAAEWNGETAAKIHSVLIEASAQYPYCSRYRPWPGPNSNTFVAWVLRRAGIDFAFPWKAIGKDYAWAGD